MRLELTEIDSPVGIVQILSDSEVVRAIDFADHRLRMERLLRTHYGAYSIHAATRSTDVALRLLDYFAGELSAIEPISVATNGTLFQRKVWSTLRTIARGTTVTYGWVARQIENPNACRAVGLANGANPVSIVVPCHRVIGANDKLTGYGGGLDRKEWLLQHEGSASVHAV